MHNLAGKHCDEVIHGGELRGTPASRTSLAKRIRSPSERRWRRKLEVATSIAALPVRNMIGFSFTAISSVKGRVFKPLSWRLLHEIKRFCNKRPIDEPESKRFYNTVSTPRPPNSMFAQWNYQTVYREVEHFCRQQNTAKFSYLRRNRRWMTIIISLLTVCGVGFAGRHLALFL